QVDARLRQQREIIEMQRPANGLLELRYGPSAVGRVGPHERKPCDHLGLRASNRESCFFVDQTQSAQRRGNGSLRSPIPRSGELSTATRLVVAALLSFRRVGQRL